jgi:hypothetical protein
VAAPGVAENADLKTLKVKHFPMIKGLKPAYAKTSEDPSRDAGDG